MYFLRLFSMRVTVLQSCGPLVRSVTVCLPLSSRTRSSTPHPGAWDWPPCPRPSKATALFSAARPDLTCCVSICTLGLQNLSSDPLSVSWHMFCFACLQRKIVLYECFIAQCSKSGEEKRKRKKGGLDIISIQDMMMTSNLKKKKTKTL